MHDVREIISCNEKVTQLLVPYVLTNSETLNQLSENQRTKPTYTFDLGHQNRDTRKDLHSFYM